MNYEKLDKEWIEEVAFEMLVDGVNDAKNFVVDTLPLETEGAWAYIERLYEYDEDLMEDLGEKWSDTALDIAKKVLKDYFKSDSIDEDFTEKDIAAIAKEFVGEIDKMDKEITEEANGALTAYLEE